MKWGWFFLRSSGSDAYFTFLYRSGHRERRGFVFTLVCDLFGVTLRMSVGGGEIVNVSAFVRLVLLVRFFCEDLAVFPTSGLFLERDWFIV